MGLISGSLMIVGLFDVCFVDSLLSFDYLTKVPAND
jgi:hypothetical protein